MIQCPKCLSDRLETDFNFKSKANNLRRSICKFCSNELSRQHYLANKQHYIDRAKISNPKIINRNIEFVNNYKSSRGCKYCSETDPCCLDFHHKNSEAKEHNVSTMAHDAASIARLESEASKCDIVCSNCHRKIHAGHICEF